ncbi:MAG: M3 family metallopeptidase [Hyphomicrobiaceae bacterium]
MPFAPASEGAPGGGGVLLAEWRTPFAMPPFGDIARSDFGPAFEQGLAEHRREIEAIAGADEPPTFDNTLLALERSGRTLEKVARVFFNLTSADTDEALQALERDMAPRLAAHSTWITSNARLFGRIDAVFEARDRLGLDEEARRLVERRHLDFIRAGAHLDAAAKARLGEIVERLASLSTRFGQNVLADEAGWILELKGEADLAGLPDWLVAATAATAAERGRPGSHLVTLSRSLVEPFLTFSDRRDLREEAFRAWTRRGEMGGASDNRAIAAEILALRAERARLLGFATFADYQLDDTMAKTPAAVSELLGAVWPKAVAKAHAERDRLAALARSAGDNAAIEPWDWRYYAEKVRARDYDLDEAALKPYLPLDAMIEAAFDTASRLFGLRFEARPDLPVYHPDVRAFEVKDRDGRHVGIFLGDYFGRPSKRSGAWMSSYRDQQRLDGGEVRPIIVNVMSFAKGSASEPALLSFDDARTLFHEFGHALHGLLSDVTYPSLSGTAVSTDFVELPSQLYEHWLEQPAVLERFARHYRTGEPMPRELIDRLRASRTFSQGFQTVEYLASALVDMDYHAAAEAPEDPMAFEKAVLARIGMPHEIVMRHRTPHFQHIFTGDHYAAGYYSYMWSEVLDADAFAAFEETGDIFDPEVAGRLKRYVYSAGGRREPKDAYLAFRGKLPAIDGLLRKRGLADAPS